MLHIAHFINRLKRVGGAEKLQVTFAEAVRHRDVRLTVVTTHPNNDIMVQREIEALGGRVVSFPGYKLYNPVRFWHLLRFIRQEGFDVIHTHLAGATILGASVGRLARVPVVTSLHNTKRNRHSIQRPVENWLLRHSVQRLVAVGWQTAEANQKLYKNKSIAVIPNAVSTGVKLTEADRKALRTELIENPDNLLIVSVGRLNPQKGYSDLLSAFALIHESYASARLVIAGEGKLEMALTTQIQQLGLQEKIKLLGARDDVPALLAASDMFVSSSHWEGLPVAILEAMAAGLPIVATGVGDVPQILPEHVGIVVPPAEPKQLAEAIGRLLDNFEGRKTLGDAARAHVNNSFSIDIWADALLNVYQEMLTCK